jgi:hypothetical protein
VQGFNIITNLISEISYSEICNDFLNENERQFIKTSINLIEKQ